MEVVSAAAAVGDSVADFEEGAGAVDEAEAEDVVDLIIEIEIGISIIGEGVTSGITSGETICVGISIIVLEGVGAAMLRLRLHSRCRNTQRQGLATPRSSNPRRLASHRKRSSPVLAFLLTAPHPPPPRTLTHPCSHNNSPNPRKLPNNTQ